MDKYPTTNPGLLLNANRFLGYKKCPNSLMRFGRDFSFALRTALENPTSTVTVLATLALGIGLTTGIYNVFYAVLLKPLPFTNPDRLVLVMEKLPQIPVPVTLPPSQAMDLSLNPIFNRSAIFIHLPKIYKAATIQSEPTFCVLLLDCFR
jgi:hypothetical protein